SRLMTTEVPKGQNPKAQPPKVDVPRAGWANPMLHVKDVARSIHFYSLIGFTLTDVEGGPDCLGWARMTSTKDDSAIMFLRAEEGHYADPAVQGILLAMYTPDLPALREHLVANG